MVDKLPPRHCPAETPCQTGKSSGKTKRGLLPFAGLPIIHKEIETPTVRSSWASAGGALDKLSPTSVSPRHRRSTEKNLNVLRRAPLRHSGAVAFLIVCFEPERKKAGARIGARMRGSLDKEPTNSSKRLKLFRAHFPFRDGNFQLMPFLSLPQNDLKMTFCIFQKKGS